MPSSSATGSPRLGAQESVDDCLEGVAMVDAAAGQNETGGTAALSVAGRYRAGLRASLRGRPVRGRRHAFILSSAAQHAAH